jgi:hypothetical protein
MKIYHQDLNTSSILNYNNRYGPLFGSNCDLAVKD